MKNEVGELDGEITHVSAASAMGRCCRVSLDLDVPVAFYTDSKKDPADAFHDDGNLHVRFKGGLRAVFTVDPSQDYPKRGDRLARKILLALKRKFTKRATAIDDD